MLFKKNSNIPTPIDEFTSLFGLSSTFKVCEACYKVGDIEYKEYLHISNQGVVDHILTYQDGFSRREINKAEVSIECVAFTTRLNLSNSTIGDIPALTFSKQQFNELVDRFDELDSEDMINILLEACQDEASVISLVRSMKNRLSSGILFLYSVKNHHLVQQEISFICGSTMNWIIRASTIEEDDWLIASPVSRSKFEEMLLLWCTETKLA